MKFNLEIDDSAVVAKFNRMPDEIHKKLVTTVYSLTEKLRTHIVRDKLMGQVLQRRTGRLGQSIQTQVSNTPSSVTGVVYSAGDVKYAAIHEFGGRTAPHVIEAKNGKALAFQWGGKQAFFKRINHPGSQMPERSFMRSALKDMEQEITQQISAAVSEVAK